MTRGRRERLPQEHYFLVSHSPDLSSYIFTFGCFLGERAFLRVRMRWVLSILAFARILWGPGNGSQLSPGLSISDREVWELASGP